MRTSQIGLLEVKLLAPVYLERMGGRQPGFVLALTTGGTTRAWEGLSRPRTTRPIQPSEAELAAHAEFLKKVKDPLWLQPPFAAGTS